MERDALKIVIADDEPPARMRLRQLVDDVPGCETIAEAQNGREVIDLCQQVHPDVVLLDIRMPDMDGIEAARHLDTLDDSPAVIFTTAYHDYALEAFDAQAIAYLLKPVRRERLARALVKAAQLTRAQLSALANGNGEAGARVHVCARRGDQLRLIPVDSVQFFQADQKYVRVCHLDGEDLIDDSLKSLEQEFQQLFVRVHRNTLVAIAHLDRLDKTDSAYSVHLKNCSDALPVSRRHVTGLKKRLRSGH